ncbi:hypothetical protein GCM10011351_27080 [Paraliobacillus quinghaiensis]|uniref:Uncharacterized protein n=1 Tax=Paraliobacillus quinghaiensis TaxID=470815 RepID=A0A917TWV3_9BACI|nr:hypothetical protein [Paraliobacillus quinghaiensis]GGM39504.1 hypothetical protein GCM10011351_27080 [Paraliobacillus quinghaiensis]
MGISFDGGFIVNKPYKLYSLEDYFKGINSEDDDLFNHFNFILNQNMIVGEEIKAYFKKMASILGDYDGGMSIFTNYVHKEKRKVSSLLNCNNLEAIVQLFEDTKIISVETNKINNYVNGLKTVGDKRQYYLMQSGESIFTELAKVVPFNDIDLVKFSKNFGLPTGYKESGLFETERSIEFISSPTLYIHLRLLEFKDIFNLFVAIKTKEPNLIKLLFSNHGDRKGIDIPENEFDEEEMYIALKSDIATELNHILINYGNNSFEFNVQTGKFSETEKIEDLFHFGYIQMKQSLINETELRKCEYCGHYFEVNHGKQRFCPPLPFRKRSSCETAYNREKNK